LQNIRPQMLEYQHAEKLFFTLSGEPESGSLSNVFTKIANQIKIIDKQFVNFKQFRASAVSLWIKTEGLRKAQYMAGHRYIGSTENYLSNNLDDLKDGIDKMHPF